MMDKLEAIKARFDNIGVSLTNPDVVSDQKKFSALSREYRKLEKIADAYKQYKQCLESLRFAKEILETENDEDLRDMAKEDLTKEEARKEELEELIRQLLIPKDPQDEKNAIMEIRAGTGGDEASLFAGDLMRMYIKYCESKGFRVAVADESEGTSGGYKEVILEITGDDVYGTLKCSPSGSSNTCPVSMVETDTSLGFVPLSKCTSALENGEVGINCAKLITKYTFL